MVNFTKEAFENSEIEVIVDSANTLWLNEKHIEEKLGHIVYQQLQTNATKYTKNTDMN